MLTTFASLILAGVIANEARCVRWTWSGDVYNRKVVCLEWSKPPKDKGTKKNV